MPLVALCLRHFLADSIICMYVFDFRHAQPYLTFQLYSVGSEMPSYARTRYKCNTRRLLIY
jgi:hypothetical protein